MTISISDILISACILYLLFKPNKIRPIELLKPRLFVKDDKWCALYGPNDNEGIVGYGDTPEEACEAFIEAFEND